DSRFRVTTNASNDSINLGAEKEKKREDAKREEKARLLD
ncbi:hypothetical protein LINPERHAP1_LOCUS9092, partial [Linum perenne]